MPHNGIGDFGLRADGAENELQVVDVHVHSAQRRASAAVKRSIDLLAPQAPSDRRDRGERKNERREEKGRERERERDTEGGKERKRERERKLGREMGREIGEEHGRDQTKNPKHRLKDSK